MSNTALNLAPVIVWAAGLSTLLSLGTTIWTMLTSGARKNDKRIDELLARVDQAERQLMRHDDQLSQMPSIEMMHRLELTLARMEGHIDKLDEKLKPVAAIAERMQELMIEQARK